MQAPVEHHVTQSSQARVPAAERPEGSPGYMAGPSNSPLGHIMAPLGYGGERVASAPTHSKGVETAQVARTSPSPSALLLHSHSARFSTCANLQPVSSVSYWAQNACSCSATACCTSFCARVRDLQVLTFAKELIITVSGPLASPGSIQILSTTRSAYRDAATLEGALTRRLRGLASFACSHSWATLAPLSSHPSCSPRPSTT